MFDKNKKPNEIRPTDPKVKDKQDEKNKSPSDNKSIKQEKADMRWEGGSN